ncbi:MAG: aspartate kinase [Saprospiraceae bacterium]|nr:aspartate kinase [Saprospiraceae bacterium]
MVIYKFGGTSVGSPERMQEVQSIITRSGERKIVVLSAVSGVTNTLVRIAEAIEAHETDTAMHELTGLDERYQPFLSDLFGSPSGQQKARLIMEESFRTIRQFMEQDWDDEFRKIILAQGELVSTRWFHLQLQETGIDAILLPALDFMRTNAEGEPDLEYTAARLSEILALYPGIKLFITQGYICRNHQGRIDNLKRGGSDYTATLVGAAVKADEIQIWTDIDGVHNNDPRVVEGTHPIRFMSYREAAELAYFGAKILHPSCVIPAELALVPIRLKNTMQPDAPGTLISLRSSSQSITAVAAKDGITVIKIYSHRMFMAYGFLRRVFEVFEKYRTPIDMITTSEVAVSLTIDFTDHLHEIIRELKQFGEVEWEGEHTILCVVGDNLIKRSGIAQKVFAAIEKMPIRMISYGGSRHNISILIPENYKRDALLQLNSLF